MNAVARRAPPVAALAVALLAAACTPPEDRAFEACRAEIARHLLHPASAKYERVRVGPHELEGEPNGWSVEIEVSAKSNGGETETASVRCTQNARFELIDLSGETAADQAAR